jgi:hypothetical protein
MPTILPPPTSDMLDLLDRLKAGGELVTAYRKTPKQLRLLAEVDGEPVNAGTVRAVITRGLVVRVKRTAATETWGPAEGQP